MKRMAIVAVESNLIGRTATPMPGMGVEHLWKFPPEDTEAEVVAVFVGDLDEGGVLKAMLRGKSSGILKSFYVEHFQIKEQG